MIKNRDKMQLLLKDKKGNITKTLTVVYNFCSSIKNKQKSKYTELSIRCINKVAPKKFNQLVNFFIFSYLKKLTV